MADALLVVKIVTDYAEGQAGLNKAAEGTSRFKSGLAKMAAPAALAVAGIAAFGKAAVDAASRTQQAIGAVDSVFGRNAGTVKAWADGAATSVGLAKSEYMELASVIGAQLKNMGVPMSKVAAQTDDLVRKGADLAATYGGTTKEAVEALGSALRGETDPIERYGVSVKQADIAAQQAKDGTDALTGAAGKQAKTMALLALVNKQTADSTGQFSEESDSAAGSAQIAAAEYENMKSALGTSLLPAVTAVMSKLGALAAVMARHRTTTTLVIGVIAALAVAILALNVAVGVYTAVTTLAGSVTVMAWVSALWPILAVIAAVALVVGAVVLLWKKSATFRKVVTAVWRAVKSGATAAARAIKSAFLATWRAIQTAARALGNAVRAVWNALRSAVSAVVSKIKNLFSGLWDRIKSGARSVRDAVSAVWTAIKSKVSAVVDGIKSTVATMWDKVKSGARGLGSVLSAPFDAMKSAIDKVVSVVQSLINWLSKIKVPSLGGITKLLPGGRSAAPPPAVPSAAGYTTPRVAGPAARGLTMAGAGGPTIVIQGAMDPEAVARQIRRIMGGHNRRVGGVSV